LIASINGVNIEIFHPKHHTWKNNNQIARNGNFEPLHRQSANVGFLYGSISTKTYRSHFGHLNFFFSLLLSVSPYSSGRFSLRIRLQHLNENIKVERLSFPQVFLIDSSVTWLRTRKAVKNCCDTQALTQNLKGIHDFRCPSKQF